MRKRAGLFIVLGSILILLLLTAVYINYMMDRVVKAINRPGIVFSDPDFSSTPEESWDEEKASEEKTNEDRKEGWPQSSPRSESVQQGFSEVLPADDTPLKQEAIKKDDIITGVQEKIDRPVDKSDLVKAGMIILRRLNWSEIEYLYKAGSKEQMSDEELRKIHKVLRSRLTSDEIKVMQDLARKYGKDLDFLSAESL
jgi:hypothetical protein